MNDLIVFSAGWRIWQVPTAGGTPKRLFEPDPKKNELGYLSPELLPDGKTLLFTVRTTGSWDEAHIVAQSLQTGERRVLIQGGATARYVRSGHLVYLKTGTLMAVPFDVTKLEIRGAPVPVVEDVMQSINMPRSVRFENGLGNFSVSDSGTLVYINGGINPVEKAELVLLDRQGREITTLKVTPGELWSPRFSSDGRRIAYVIRRGTEQLDVWVYDIERRTPTRYTFKGNNYPAAWSPDGTKLAFSTRVQGVSNLFWISADGNGSPQQFAAAMNGQLAASWSEAGLAYIETTKPGAEEIWVLPVTGEEKPKPFLRGDMGFVEPEFSSDAKWVAYSSNESGTLELYVRPYPGPGPRFRISTEQGRGPVWRRNDREIFYVQNAGRGRWRVMSVEVETSPAFKAGKPRILFEGNFEYKGSYVREFDVSPDGQQFVVIRPIDEPEKPATEINVVLNWAEELKRLVPAK